MKITSDTEAPSLVTFANNFSLLLKLVPPYFKKSYGYVLTIKNGPQQNTVKYEVDITYIKTIPEQARIFKIEKTTPVFINDMEPDLLADKLASEVGSVLYPLIVEVDFDGQLLAIHNYEEIKQRWAGKRQEIKEYFTGPETERYCQLMDRTIASESALNWNIQKDMLIAAYFAPIYKSYTPQLKITQDAGYPVAGLATPVLFNTTQAVQQNLNKLGAIELLHAGTAIDERSITDLEQQQNWAISKAVNDNSIPAEGKYTARYMLHAQTKAIRAIDAEWVLSLQQQRSIRVGLHETVKDPEVMTPGSGTANAAQTSVVLLDKDTEQGNMFSNIWRSIFG
jgi:hypothetical protein